MPSTQAGADYISTKPSSGRGELVVSHDPDAVWALGRLLTNPAAGGRAIADGRTSPALRPRLTAGNDVRVVAGRELLHQVVSESTR